MNFDITGARQAGYSDSEIVDFLGQQRNFNVAGARQAGYSTEDILSFLTSQDQPQPQQQAAVPRQQEPTAEQLGRGLLERNITDPVRRGFQNLMIGAAATRALYPDSFFGLSAEEAAQAIGERQRTLEQIPRTEASQRAFREAAETQSVPGAVGRIASSSSALGDIPLESLGTNPVAAPVGMLANVTPVPIVRQVIGAIAGALGFPTEYLTSVGGGVLEAAQRRGIDVRDTNQVAALIREINANPEMRESIRSDALTRAGIITAADVAAGYGAGRLVSRGPIGRIGGAAAIEGAGGGAGEAAAQLATTGVIEPVEVAAEIIGGAGMGALGNIRRSPEQETEPRGDNLPPDLREAIDQYVANRDLAPQGPLLLPREARDIETPVGSLSRSQLERYMERSLPGMIEAEPAIASRMEAAGSDNERLSVFRDILAEREQARLQEASLAQNMMATRDEARKAFEDVEVQRRTGRRPPPSPAVLQRDLEEADRQIDALVSARNSAIQRLSRIEGAPTLDINARDAARSEIAQLDQVISGRQQVRDNIASSIPETERDVVARQNLRQQAGEAFDIAEARRWRFEQQISADEVPIELETGVAETIPQQIDDTRAGAAMITDQRYILNPEYEGGRIVGGENVVDIIPTDSDGNVIAIVRRDVDGNIYDVPVETNMRDLVRVPIRESARPTQEARAASFIPPRGVGLELDPRIAVDRQGPQASARTARAAEDEQQAEREPTEAEARTSRRVEAQDRINALYLNKLMGMGAQGRLLRTGLVNALKNRDLSADQVYAAFVAADVMAQVLPKGANHRIEFVKSLLAPSSGTVSRSGGTAGQEVQGLRWAPNQDGLSGLIQISLAPEQLDILGETAAHEAFHVLQDYFGRYDPKFADLMSRGFRDGMMITDVDPTIRRKLEQVKVPGSDQSYWQTLTATLSNPMDAKEAQAYVFGSLVDASRRGVPMSGLKPAFARFVNMVKNFFSKMGSALRGDGFQTVEQVLGRVVREGGRRFDQDVVPGVRGPGAQASARVQAPEQKISSAGTSVKQIPATFKTVDFKPGTVNLDYGGGKYDLGTEYLRDKGVENFVYDKFNRSEEHNNAVLSRVGERGADTVTVNNVLNVVAEPSVRDFIIQDAARYLKPDGTAYFLVYEGDKSGTGKETSKGFQNNERAESYVPAVKEHFNQVSRKGNLIVAKSPKAAADFAEGQGGLTEPQAQASARATNTTVPEFRNWWNGGWRGEGGQRGPSAASNPDGSPMTMYHGTPRSFERFSKARSGAAKGTEGPFFFSPDPGFASDYAESDLSAGGRGMPVRQGAKIYPVYISVQNPFDYENPGHVQSVLDAVKMPPGRGMDAARVLRDSVRLGMWRTLEQPYVQRAIRDLGFDGFYMKEGGVKNLAVYDPRQVKSIFNQFQEGAATQPQFSARTPLARDPSYSAAVDKITGKQYDKPNPFSAALRAFTGALPGESNSSALLRTTVNRAAPGWMLDRLAKEKGLSVRSVGRALEVALNNSGRVQMYLDHGPLSYDPKTGDVKVRGDVPGLMAAIKGRLNPKDKREAQAYLVALRERDLRKTGKQGFFNLTDTEISQIISKAERNHPDWKQMAADLQKINKALLEFAVNTGTLDQSKANQLANIFYTPFYRQAEEDGKSNADSVIGPRLSDSLTKVKTAFDVKMEGGESPLGDLFQNLIRNADVIMKAGMKNVAMRQAAEVMEAVGLGRKLKTRVAGKTMTYRVDGKDQHFEVDDPVLYMALAGAPREFTNGLYKAMATFAGFLREAITLAPSFMLGNLWRGKFMAYVQEGVPLYANTFGGLKQALQASASYKAIAAQTGFGGYTYGMGERDAAKAFEKEIEGLGYTSPRGLMRKAIKGLRDFSEATEMAERIKLYERAKASGMSDKEAAFQAYLLAPFSRRGMGGGLAGDFVSFLVPLVPFLNARIQGLYRLIENEKGDTQKIWTLGLPKQLLLRGLIVTGLSVALAAMNMDFEPDRWNNENPDLKFRYDIVYLPGGNRLLLPRAFEVGSVFGAIPVFIMDAIRREDGRDLAKALGDLGKSTFFFNPIPAAAAPLIGAFTNYDFFRARPLENAGDMRKLTEERINRNTTTAARLVGAAMGISPIRAQYLLEGYSGTIGTMIFAGLDNIFASLGMIPGKPAGAFGDPMSMPAIIAGLTGASRFYRSDDQSATRFIGDFYRIKEMTDQLIRSQNMATESRDIDRLAELRGAEGLPLRLRPMVNSASTRISEINARMARIERSDMDATSKAEALRPLRQQRDMIARNVVEAARRIGAY